LNDFVGSTVLAINGESALTHIIRFANFSVGTDRYPLFSLSPLNIYSIEISLSDSLSQDLPRIQPLASILL